MVSGVFRREMSGGLSDVLGRARFTAMNKRPTRPRRAVEVTDERAAVQLARGAAVVGRLARRRTRAGVLSIRSDNSLNGTARPSSARAAERLGAGRDGRRAGQAQAVLSLLQAAARGGDPRPERARGLPAVPYVVRA